MKLVASHWNHARRAFLALVLIASLAIFLQVVNGHYPIRQWLFWHYAAAGVSCLAFIAACLSTGHLIVARLLGTKARVTEHVFLSFVAGVMAFSWAMVMLGALRLYHPVSFVLLPLAMIAAGALPSLRWAKKVRRRLEHVPRRRSFGAWRWPIIVFGLVGFALIWFSILTPDNIQFDSRWKHLAFAEDLAASGGLRRFPEGWIFAARPHFASFLYTWAFLMPKSVLFDRLELAQHLELTIFALTTVAGIGAVVRRLVPRADPSVVWVARFLFPGVLLYDSSLSAGADHIGAMYGPAIFLVLLHTWRSLRPGPLVLLSFLLCSAAITKETTAMMLVPVPIAVVAVRWIWLVASTLRRRTRADRWLWLAPVVAIGACLVASAPQWLKNVIHYGNPVYPMLGNLFPSRPWSKHAADVQHWAYFARQFSPLPMKLSSLEPALKALATFSLEPNDWPQFHGKVPVFGSLFTLFLPCLLVLRKTRRIWGLVGWIHFSILVWYWVHRQDRYLQGLAPLMAAVVAALIVRVWRERSKILRSLVGLLVFAQVVWGGDVYFIPTHAMIGSTIKRVADLLASGYHKQYDKRLLFDPGLQALGARVPRGGLLLFHDARTRLGIGVPVVSDRTGDQLGISYGARPSPREVQRLLVGFGVTHVAWKDQFCTGLDSVAGDLAFFRYAYTALVDVQSVDGYRIGQVPPSPPPEADERTLVLDCGHGAQTGIYPLAALDVPSFGPFRHRYPAPERRLGPGDLAQAARDVPLVASNRACPRVVDLNGAGLTHVASCDEPGGSGNQKYDLWVRIQR